MSPIGARTATIALAGLLGLAMAPAALAAAPQAAPCGSTAASWVGTYTANPPGAAAVTIAVTANDVTLTRGSESTKQTYTVSANSLQFGGQGVFWLLSAPTCTGDTVSEATLSIAGGGYGISVDATRS
ncbi:hypothetical protein [Sinosporangium siamense]|uniref:Uncharacterized protein n=1 Tax=Sinosporangium siamense TaxID=1367973 RepID=A0A919REN2_9ACTN|nr:hypothetical protein [Sinosporangium siamense]GII90491.1 hypothetical protein Ssi02_07220 [Sinosporangium siamense]